MNMKRKQTDTNTKASSKWLQLTAIPIFQAKVGITISRATRGPLHRLPYAHKLYSIITRIV